MKTHLTNPKVLRKAFSLILLLLFAMIKANATTRTVTNTNSTGSGSFDAAISAAASGDIIKFNFSSGSAPFVINLPYTEYLTPSNITIDGTTASGYTNAPVVQLDGATNSLANGLEVDGAGCTIIGISITNVTYTALYLTGNNFTMQNCYLGVKPDGTTAGAVFQGIYASGVSGLKVDGVTHGHNVIETTGNPCIWLAYNGSTGTTGALIKGTYCGVDATGAATSGTTGYGIYFDNAATGNTVGGTGTSGNVISGCTNYGVYFGDGSNVFKGNIVGLNAAGTSAVGNLYGIYDVANGNTIGGTAVGEGNVISGNTADGITLDGFSGCKNALVVGNYIGVNAAGTAAIANSGTGININGNIGGSTNAVIGGTTTGTLNIISGNKGSGISLSQAPGTTIRGNYIGLNAAGTASIPNGTTVSIPGINVSVSSNTIIGGTTTGCGNVISGNKGDGIQITSSTATIQGNIIGLDPSGTSAIANGRHGLFLNGTLAVTVGGTTYQSRNFISGNTSNGINIASTGTHVIQNNFIGLNKSGTAVANSNDGVMFTGASPVFGVNGSGKINYISGNTKHGVEISASSVTVINCYIGTDSTGTVARPNGSNGVNLTSGSNITIGSVTSGSGNVISGNTGTGITVVSTGSNNTVIGNLIGTDLTGTSAIANVLQGIYMIGGAATGNFIGGTTAGTGNLISGNTSHGIQLDNSQGGTIAGNKIGLNLAGTSAIANGGSGINVTTGSIVTIGGFSLLARNFIAGHSGVRSGVNVSGNAFVKIQNNYIGTDITGATAIANGTGITTSAVGTVTIGSDLDGSNDATEGNIISGNTTNGISLTGSSAVVYGNIIGLNASGTALANGTGILITGTFNTIGSSTATTGAANTISKNTGRGVYIQNASATNNVIQGNYIGTNTGGTSALGNGLDGVIIDAGKTNTIGGAATTNRNIISDNTASGIFLTNGATGNTIANNYLGTDVNGTSAIKNGSYGLSIGSNGNTVGPNNLISGNNAGGISINSANTNIIKGNLLGVNASGTAALNNNNNTDIFVGGSSTGNIIGGTPAADRNIISGSAPSAGIVFAGSSNGNTVEGNYIGTDINGTSAIPNTVGISITSGPNAIGALNAGNVISGNNSFGISITAGGSNTILGNIIGLEKTGTTALANTGNGINIQTGSNTIGSTTSGGQNIISGNTSAGILLTTAGATLNLLQNNYIGLNAAGTGAVANGGGGISITASASGNTIGGATSGQGNVISGNTGIGIKLNGGGSNIVKGNIVGLNATGTAAKANTSYGIQIQGSETSDVIGGTTAAERNTIAGNTNSGLIISSGTNTVQGNYFGTDITGTAGIANGSNGNIFISASNNNIIGGGASGAGNLLSGCTNGYGVYVSSGTGNIIKGNYIGTNAAGTGAIPNLEGVYTNAGNTVVGGSGSGEGNVIAGNKQYGFAADISASGAIVKGNYIGVDATGNAALGNGGEGIILYASNNHVIGGTVAGEGNIIACNSNASGIIFANCNLWMGGAQNSTVQGNYIGIFKNGTTETAGKGAGVYLDNGNSVAGVPTKNNTIGGSAAGSANVMSGNRTSGTFLGCGVYVKDALNTIQGNIIGLDPTGTSAVANASDGIRIDGSTTSTANVIKGNTISGNTGNGIYLKGTSSGTTAITGNQIGLNLAGTATIGNTVDGILIESANNTIGGAGSSANTIAGNTSKGIAITGATSIKNLITKNSMYGDGFGIDLNNDGVTANDASDVDAGPNGLQNYPVITSITSSGGNTTIVGTLNSTSSSTFNIEFFNNVTANSSGYGEGKTYIGNASVTTDASGNASISSTFAGTYLTVSTTATDALNNTSEFSKAPTPVIQVQTVANVVIPNNTATPTYKDSTHTGVTITRTFWIKNTGIITLNVSNPTGLTGYSFTGFPMTLPQGDSARFTAKLTAVSNGIYTGYLPLTTNDPANATFNLELFGFVGCWNAQFVDPSGNDTATGSSSASPRKTVQAAVNAICDGGTVYLAPGNTYAETVNSSGKNIDFGFTTTSSAATTITNLTINGSGKTVTLSAPLTVTGTLTMTNGNLTTSSTAPLILSGNSASVSGGSTSSFINGPVQFSIFGTQTKTTTLPIGKGSVYRPISVFTDITDGASAGNTFQAEMFNTDPHTLGLTLPAGDTLRSAHYYQIDHIVSNGTVNGAKVTLPFIDDATTDSISSLTSLHILKGNGSGGWADESGTATGAIGTTFYNGTITSGSFTTFSPFGLATVSAGCGANPQPVVDYSYSNTCVGTSVSFTNATTISSGTITSYVWDFGDGSAQVTQTGSYPPNPAGPTHTYTTAGTFTLNLVATSALGCQVTLTKYITISPNPQATFTSVPSEVCFGSNPTITFNVSNVATTDNWTLNYSTTNPASNVNVSGTGAGSFTFTTASLSGPSSNIVFNSITNTTTGCANNSLPTKTITVDPATVAGTVAGAATVCNGNNSGTVTASGGTGSIIRWEASVDAGASWVQIANTTATQGYFNITNTTSFRAIYQSGVCATAAATAVTITVKILPTASINSGTTICAGTTAGLTVTVANTGGANWSISYSEGPTTKTLTGNGNGSFTLTTGTLSSNTDVTLLSITETSGSPTCSNSSLNSKATIVVNPLPSATIGSGSTICSGSTATISVTVSDVASTDAWTLSYNEGATAKTISGTGPGSYTITTSALASNTAVTLTSIKNNTTTCTQAESGSATITVNPATVAGTTSGTATVCSGSNSGTVKLAGNTGSVVKWQYSIDGGTTFTDIANTTTSQNYTNITATTIYQAIVQSGVCPTATSTATTITVNPLPTATIGGGTTICAGNTANLTVTVANVSASQLWTVTYLEGSTTQILSNKGSGSFTLTTSTLNSTTNYVLQSIVITSGAPTCSNNSLTGNTSATVTVNPLPSATIGSGSTICSGSTATISVTVSDVASTDAWTLSYNEGATAKTISGTGPGNFTITTSALASNTTVTLTSIKNNTTTCTQALSGSATITVNPATVAGTTSGTATVCSGSNSGTVKLSGNTGSVVKWQYSTDGGTTFTDIANTGVTQNYTNLTTTTIFQAVVQSGVCASSTSSATTITVNPLPTVSISGSTTICSGTTASLTVTTANVASGQTWTLTYLEGTNTKTLTGTGSGNTTLTTSVLSATTDYTLQSIVESGGAVNCSNSSLTGNVTATVKVNQLPNATISNPATSVCSGSTASFNVNVTSVTATDNWSLTYTTTNPSTTNTVTGTGAGTFAITTPALSGGASSTIKITAISNTTTSCSGAPSATATVTIDPSTVAGTMTGAATVCYGNNSGSIAAGAGTGNITRWEYSTDAGATWASISNTTSSEAYSNLTVTTQYRAVYKSGSCSEATAIPVTITVNQLPTAVIGSGLSICSGTTATLIATIANTNGQAWSLSYTEGVTAKTLTGTGNGNFNIVTSTLTTNTDIVLQGIKLTSGSPLCANNALTGTIKASVVVNPLPSATINGSQTICTGSAPLFNVSVSNVPSGNNWTLSYNEGATAKTLTGTGSGTFAMNTSVLNNAGASSTTVTYTLTNIVNTSTALNCNSTTFTGNYVVTINPATTAGTLSGTATSCGTVNSGTIILSGNVGSVVRWEYSTDGGNTWNNIANTTTSQTYNNLALTTIYRTLVQSGVCAAAYSATATITVNPQPSASISGSQTICSGSTPAISATVTNVPSGQNWSLSYLEGATGKTLTGTGSGTFALNASALTNGTGSQTTVVYSLGTITNTSLSCTSLTLTSTYSVKIDPTTVGGTLSTGSPAVCNGTNSGSISLSGQTGSIVRWEYSTDAGATWVYVVNTSNSLTFSSLALTRQYRVLVQSGTCASAYSSTQVITVNPLPIATIAGNNSVCTNNTSIITFSVSNVAASDNWTINYTVNGSAQTFTGTGLGNFNYTTPVMTYPPLNVVYSLTGISNGTTGCNNSASGTATIQVNPKPVVSFTSTDVCFGLAMSFRNKSTIPAGTINAYRWDFGDGSASTSINPDYTYAAAGTYNVKLVVYTQNGCKDSLTKTVNVFPKPVASFTTANTCESDSGLFTSTSKITGGTIKTTSWDFGDGGTSSLVNPKHKYDFTGTFDVTINVISDKGCSNSASQHVTVYPLPTANFSADAVCEYDSMQFVNLSGIPYGALTYKWTFEPGKTSSLKEPKYRFSGPGNFFVKLVATSSFGCRDSVVKMISIDPKPKASFTSKDVCIGNDNVFTNTSTVKTGVVDNVFWNFGDTTYASGNIVSHRYRLPGKYTVTFITRSGKGCIDTASQVITVHGLPSAKITAGGPLNFCSGGSVSLSAPAGLTYVWNTGATTQSITVKKSGVYRVVVTEPFGCSGSDSVRVIVYPSPIANAGNDTTISKGFSAHLHGSGGTQYHWAPPGSLDNPDSKEPTATPQQTTSYILTITDANGCSSSDTVLVTVIDDHKVITYNTISPNGDGMNDSWVIDNIATFQGATVTIYNRYGQVLYQTNDYKNDWKGTFNGQDLPEGTYYYTIAFTDNDKVYKGAINILRNAK